MAHCLIIPGIHDSGPDYWQSRWLAGRPDCEKVELGRWSEPKRTLWVSRLDRAVARSREDVVLVAHSLGCLAVVWWSLEASAPRLEKVRAALLVAPPDVDRADALPTLRPFAPSPVVRLPFRSVLVASRDDLYASFSRALAMGRAWGSEVVDHGYQGHLNAKSKLGDWTEGQHLLRRLILREPIEAELSGRRAAASLIPEARASAGHDIRP